MNNGNLYLQRLRSRGFRLTPQRLAILKILEESNCHLTPTDIYHRAAEQLPGLTEPTVYRTLNFLAEQGLALVAHIGNGQFVYESAARQHHHLICRSCGKMLEIDHKDIRQLYNSIQEHTGFLIDSMHLTFFGLCPQCQAAEGK